MENAPSAPGATSYNKSNYEKFYEMRDLLEKLKDTNLIAIGIDPGNQQRLMMRIKQTRANKEDLGKFKRNLALKVYFFKLTANRAKQ
jgi:hypothetical protein